MDAFESGLQGLAAALAMVAPRVCYDVARHRVRAVGAAGLGADDTTDTDGLDGRRGQDPVADGAIPAYRAMPRRADRSRRCSSCRRSSACTSTSRTSAAGLRSSDTSRSRPELYARQGDAVQDQRHRGDPQADRRPRCRTRRSCPTSTRRSPAPRARARPNGASSPSPASAGAGGSSGSMRRTIRSSRPASPGTGRSTRPRTELQPKNPIDVAADLKAPVLGLYGGADHGIPVETIEQMREAPARRPARPARSRSIRTRRTPSIADYRPSYREQAAKDGWSTDARLVQGPRGGVR